MVKPYTEEMVNFLQDRPWYPSFIDPDQEEYPEKHVRSNDQFPEIVSYERAKDKLEELCAVLEMGPPCYSIVSQTDPDGTIAMVTIEGIGSADAYEFRNAQWCAARNMYFKLTGEDVSLKQAKPSLRKLCLQQHYPEPQYETFPGHFEIAVTVDDMRCEASSYKSAARAEKEAAKKMYALLRNELADY